MSDAGSEAMAGDTKQRINRAIRKTLRAEGVTISKSIVGALAAGNDAGVSGSLSAVTAAGHDAVLESTASSIVVSGHDLSITNGGAGFMMVGGDARVEHGFVAVLMAGKASLTNGTRVLMTLPMAIGFGAAFGLFFGVASVVLKNRLGNRR